MQIVKDYYKVLGIPPTASIVEIKLAYRKLAFRYHPDRNQTNQEANEKMQEINEAFTTLSDPFKRRKYDVPLGYRTILPKFNTGCKVRVSSRSSSYKDHTGVVEKPPFNDTFRFWYMVKFESNGLAMVNRFAEEELHEVDE